jgi:DNA-binding NtrC family response regulator
VEPLRVLIVDDEEEFVNALVERLGLRDIEATGVITGEEALSQIDSQQFDVVLLDVKMPGLGGFQVIERIKEKQPDLAVILLSGHTAAHEEHLGDRLGCYAYLIKPVKFNNLVEILNQAANRTCEEK